MKGDLASFKNAKEQLEAKVDSSSEWYWFGFTDEEKEGEWVWLENSNNVWQNWGKTSKGPQPNGGTDENCAALYINGKWIDTDCEVLRFFVCKVPGAY